MNQNSKDPSVQFVRWIKTQDATGNSSSARKRQMYQTTKHTLRMAELATPMMDVIVDDEDGTLSSRYNSSGANSLASQASSIGRRGRWQCLEDVNMEGIDLCPVPVQMSHEEGGTTYMLGIST
jgi:hypothetical protein